MEIPDGYRDMMTMIFSVHAQKPEEVRAKYYGYQKALATDMVQQGEYTNSNLEAFQVADANNDGALDRAEYDVYIQRMCDWQDEMFGGHNQFTPEQVQMIFDQLSQGGSITKEAFVQNLEM